MNVYYLCLGIGGGNVIGGDCLFVCRWTG